jgi:hypothetical protein
MEPIFGDCRDDGGQVYNLVAMGSLILTAEGMTAA